jgi:DNA segregation ATPase FtsK/SpoIIIE and related proteins
MQEAWELACHRNGIVRRASLADASAAPPALLHHDQAKGIFYVESSGVTLAQLRAALPALSASLPFRLLEVRANGESFALLYEKFKLPEKLGVAKVPRDGKIYIGLGGSGWFAQDEARSPHMMVAGATGWGKSTFLNFLCWQYFRLDPQCKVIVLSAKEDDDFAAAQRLGAKVIFAQAEIDAELDALEELRAGRARDRVRTPKVYLLIDEFHECLNKTNVKALIPLVTMGRSHGFRCVLSSQRPTIGDSMLPGKVRANLSLRVCFPVNENSDSHIMTRTNQATVDNMPEVLGRALVRSGKSLVEVQTPLL